MHQTFCSTDRLSNISRHEKSSYVWFNIYLISIVLISRVHIIELIDNIKYIYIYFFLWSDRKFLRKIRRKEAKTRYGVSRSSDIVYLRIRKLKVWSVGIALARYGWANGNYGFRLRDPIDWAERSYLRMSAEWVSVALITGLWYNFPIQP